MDVTLLFWTGALLDLLLVALLSWRGVALRRAGDIPGHRRAMTGAGLLVAFFLGAYVLKLIWLGREDRSDWTAADRALLWFHESCVLAMLVGGALARWRARHLGAGAAPAPGAAIAAARFHRRAGWAAVVGAALGLATAAGVLFGMYRRAGLV